MYYTLNFMQQEHFSEKGETFLRRGSTISKGEKYETNFSISDRFYLQRGSGEFHVRGGEDRGQGVGDHGWNP
jgi:hypothetical protein